ncbi:MAG TPA: isopeptide-forming domain-containing fimbrial protein [Candidatus Egerieisoma faecipullorum]|uniref:Isopeptide-forming domain-containing fimbrial protein n=1 Tax=Candidatus Egerieisoma faecipullorum TaxID=2840963 RepID=A0A9D1I8L6_9CLOT|nr:isopeptide-forming domain-containing fimbrial protein [Candidatus Egerieisoma faecipullorum]
MKNTKKAAVLLLSLFLALITAVPVFAQEGTYSITIENEASGHIYEAYQIFAGRLSTDDEGNVILSDITWGTGVNGEALLTALQAADAEKYGSCATAAEAAESIGATSADAEAFADIAENYLTGTKAESTAGDGSYVISGLDAGYYLVMDQEDSLEGAGSSYTAYILQVLGNVTMQPKDTDIPTLEKKVWEDDDADSSSGYGNGYYEAADHTIGDVIPFKLIGSIPDMTDYDSYTYRFHDTQSAGLTLHGNSFEVYLVDDLNAELDALTPLNNEGNRYYTVNTDPGNGETFTVSFSNLKTVPDVADYTHIVVAYTAELNENAKTGQKEGNPNEVYLEFSNNPNGEGFGRTEKQYVVVFTYTLNGLKYDGNFDSYEKEARLAGAKFVLLNSTQNKAALVAFGGTFIEWVDLPGNAESYADVTLEEWNNMYADAGRDVVLTSSSIGIVRISGLDDDEYYLLEIEAPAGYNMLKAPVKVSITSVLQHVNFYGSNQDQILTDLYAIVNDDAENPMHCTMLGGGTVTVPLANFSGTTLPETGGIGTTFFFAAGGVLAVGAGILLVVRKRVKSENK